MMMLLCAANHHLDLDLDRDLSSSSVDRNEALLKKHITVIIVQNFHNHRLNCNCRSKFTSKGWWEKIQRSPTSDKGSTIQTASLTLREFIIILTLKIFIAISKMFFIVQALTTKFVEVATVLTLDLLFCFPVFLQLWRWTTILFPFWALSRQRLHLFLQSMC